MDKPDHASIDIKKLGNSVRGKLESLYPLSQEFCIYKVPKHKWCLNPSDYTPQMVSIGPIHHGQEGLKAMEEHKMRYLQCFLQRTEVSIEGFLALIKDRETKLRNCFADIIKLRSDDFLTMILLDAVFLIEIFLRYCKPDLITDDDRIFGQPWIDVWSDLWLVENQIPLFILNDLFNLAITATTGDHYEGLSLITITSYIRHALLEFIPVNDDSFRRLFEKAKHFLDMERLCLEQYRLPAAQIFKAQNIPSATELHQAGVKLKKESSKNPLDITFENGVLEIPFLTVYDKTQRFYRNILAFENMYGNTRYFNDYVIMMSYLVRTEKDAELLIQNEIVGLGNGERLSSVFHNLVKESYLGHNFQYSVLVEDLRTYCKYRRHKWKAILEQNYCHNPWASISVIAAVILLVLTFIQTACSVISL